MAFFIKYEFWANFLIELNKRDIPVYLVSAIFRPEQIFFKKYGGFFRSLLPMYKAIFVQDEKSLSLVNSVSKSNVIVSGDTRFDRVTQIKESSKDLPLIANFVQNSEFAIVAGATMVKDEDILIDSVNKNNNVKLIIATHEFHTEHTNRIISIIKCQYSLYS